MQPVSAWSHSSHALKLRATHPHKFIGLPSRGHFMPFAAVAKFALVTVFRSRVPFLVQTFGYGIQMTFELIRFAGRTNATGLGICIRNLVALFLKCACSQRIDPVQVCALVFQSQLSGLFEYANSSCHNLPSVAQISKRSLV